MMTTVLCHPQTNWKVRLSSDNLDIHNMWKECFKYFKLYITNDETIQNIEKQIIVDNVTNGSFQIRNTNLILDDLESVVGLSQEILFGPHFLQSSQFTYLHGAVLAKNGLATLIIAPTMSGKTTLTTILCTKGYNYLSDDVIAINNADLSVVTFPKTLCIRDMKLILSYNSSIDKQFDKLNFSIKTLDNTSNKIEKRIALFPKNIIPVNKSLNYPIEKIFVLRRNYDNEMICSIKSLNSVESFLALLKNLRSPNNFNNCKNTLGKLSSQIMLQTITYSKGFEYLKFFNTEE